MMRMEPALAKAKLKRADAAAGARRTDLRGAGGGSRRHASPIVKSVMEDAPHPAVALHVPLQVDARAADNWDEAH